MWKLFKRKSTPEPRKVERSIHENMNAESTVTIFEPKKIWFKDEKRTIASSKDRKIQCTGLYITEHKGSFKSLVIKIINSKRDVSRQLAISIPKNDVPQLIKELEHYCKSV